MLRLSLFLFLVSSLPICGQDNLLRALSQEVCDCLEGKTSETVARDCLESVTITEAKTIRRRYDLDVTIPFQRSLFAEVLLDQLMEACPLLQTVRPSGDRNEFRWADGGQAGALNASRFTARKRPAADTTAIITSEPPLVWRAAGKLLAQPGSKGLRLLNDAGQEINFELPASVARKRDFDPGDQVRLSFRREWRPKEGRIVLVVENIE